MSPKNGNTVALERRMDLASLFCMIGRHGPAVALAVIAVVSVLAGFVIYRSVRGKRRKATAGGDRGESPGAERDAALIQTETCPEESRSSAESTDVSDEGSSDMKDDADLKIRHRRATTEKKPPPYSPLKTDSVLDDINTSAVQDCYEAAETYAEEANRRSDTCTVAEVDMEDIDWHQEVTLRDAEEEHNDGSSLKPGLNYESGTEEEKVLPAKCQEDENVTADKDVYDERTSRREETLQCVLESPVCCEQKPHTSENGEKDNEATPDKTNMESLLEEPVVHIEDVPVSSICYSKDGEFEEENRRPDDTGDSNYCNDQLPTQEEIKKEDEEVEEAFVIAQQAEIVYSTSEQETSLLSSQQKQCDVEFDAPTLQQQLKTEQKTEEGLACNEEDDSVKDEMLLDSSSVVLAAPLPSLNQPEQIDGGVCGATTDAKAHISGVVDFPGLSSNYQQSQSEVKEDIAPVLDKDTDLDVAVPDSASLKEEIQSEKNGTAVVLAKESVDQEASLRSSQQEHCDDVTTEVALSSQKSDQREDRSLTGEATEEDVKEDHLNNLTKVGYEQQLQTELKNGLPCNQDGVGKGEMPASCDEDCKSSSVVLAPALPEKFAGSDDGVCGATTDAKAQISGTVDFPDLSSDYQQPQSEVKEDKFATVLDKETDLDALASDLLSLKEEMKHEKNQGSVDQKANLPSSQLEQCEEVTAEVVLSSQEHNQGDDHGLSSKTTEEDINEDHLRDLINVGFGAPILLQQLQTEQISDIASDQEDSVVKVEMLASCDEECESSSVVLTSALSEKIDNGDGGVCGATTDTEAQISGVPQLHLDYPPPQAKEDGITPVTDLDSLSFDVPSLKEESQSKKMEIDTAVVLPEEIVDHILSSCYQDQQSDQNNADFPEVTTGAALVMTESNKPPTCQIQLSSYEQSELTWSSSGFDGESGISSMTISPDLENLISECLLIPENAELPVLVCDPQSEVQTEAQINPSADDVALSVTNEDAACVGSEACPSHLSPPPQSEPKGWANNESFLSNEDTFGHEVEDSYNRAMDQFLLQFAASVAPDEKKKQTDVKAVETKKKKKEGAKEEEEEEEDYEKTEISIMEATMDNNEWITEGNYQVLPWMNLSVPSSAQSPTKTKPVPSEERHRRSSPADPPCIDVVIPLPFTEQTNTISLVDESLENIKKVVAVQPMPQNVSVTFRIHYHTHSPYQKVAITGDQQELGNWKEFIPLEKAKDGHWSTVVSLPAESHVEWKFVVLDKGDVCRWEECGNRLLDTGSGEDLLVHKWWGIL